MSEDLRAARAIRCAECGRVIDGSDPAVTHIGCCIGSEGDCCQSGEHEKLRREALRAALAASDALNVERLARALQVAMTDTGRSVDYSPLAAAIAREYAALRSTPEAE